MRSLNPLEKLKAITRVSVGGESKASVARDIGVPESTLRGWCKNHDKISNQVRMISPSEGEDIHENVTKRIKLEPSASEHPYDLSVKSSDNSDGPYSPISDRETSEGEYPKPAIPEMEAKTSPLNFTKAMMLSPTEKNNKAELAKMSAQLGLNRPEVKSALNQWLNTMQQYCQQQRLVTKPPNISPPGNGLLTTVEKRDKLYQYQNSLERENASFWLRQQAYCTNPQIPYMLPSTSAATNGTTTSPSFLTADSASQLSLQLLYQQNYQLAQLHAAAAAASASQPILRQQLTKETNSENQIAENTKKDKPKNGTKSRSVLDNLPLINNHLNNIKKEDVEPMDPIEALEHGERFLSWLEQCSDPAVTSMQLNTVQTLIKNLKNAFEQRRHPNRSRKMKK